MFKAGTRLLGRLVRIDVVSLCKLVYACERLIRTSRLAEQLCCLTSVEEKSAGTQTQTKVDVGVELTDDRNLVPESLAF